MKQLISILVFLWTIHASAQVKPVTSTNKPPAFYLDSVKVNSNYLFIDPGNIESVDVVKGYDTSADTYGKVFIKMKNKNLLASLKQITDVQASKNRESQVLYIVDNKIITDTVNVRFDTSYIKSVHFTSAASIQYLKGSPQITICTIETKAAPKTPQKPGGIILKGAAMKEDENRN
jgi:hypothetical protein